ncbi:MAG: 4Fe-4S dicluster domain-containing protein [Erysipelotrichaceae bacterium]|nr:4Fe-4S dicluster domain-containing protein [Erysipelotrichaceae bacterium]
MQKFDTKVQYLKYQVLREVAKFAWEDTLAENVLGIPESIVPGRKPTMRCCVYKERAILTERVKIAMGNYKDNDHIMQVIDIACDGCPVGGYQVTSGCRGCLSHQCKEACKFGAISFDENYVSHIDKEKCKECGMCAKVCPYSAIIHLKRPCQNACKVKAIDYDENKTCVINYDKCISCGACAYQCPFGAISDRSYILDVVKVLKEAKADPSKKVYAVIAPSIGTQFTYATVGKVIAGIKKLGFTDVAEAALGADIVAINESKELLEKGFLTSSCCPGFVKFIENTYPDIVPYISHNPSPMVAISTVIKESYPGAKIIFIGPCTAKKAEVQREEVKDIVDYVITFEELQALLDSRDIDITALEEDTLTDASAFGRGFAKCGGLAVAVKEALKEMGHEDFDLKAVSSDGIEECNLNLIKWSKKVLDVNFIEGMACIGGCVGGAGCMTHSVQSKVMVDKYSKQAQSTIADALDNLDV